MQEHYDKWKIMAPLGLMMIGLGFSLAGHGTNLKGQKKPGWVLFGTLGLLILNAGISVFGDSVKHRVLYEIKRDIATG